MPDVTRIIEQKATESIYNDDWILIDRPTEGEDGGTRKILASNLKELFCGDYIADEWESLVTYNYGRFVTHEGKLYYNNSGGALVQITFNSNAWLEVRIDELLEKVIGSIGEKWRRVDTYRYDDLVVYGGRLYRCIKNASTQGTWVSNEWIEANAEYYFKKVREYIARYGFVPRREAISSPYNKGDLILYRAPGDTTNSLYMRLNDTEHGDSTWIPENWLKVENIGGALSKIYDDMEESSCDVQIKEQSIIDENHVADLTSLAAVGSASGAIATFDDGSDLPMPSLKVAIEPQQDLHGYDRPWVGGTGKNKYLILIGDDGFVNNQNATHSSDNGILVINATASTNSGCYSHSSSTIRNLISEFTGDITFSFDVKSNVNTTVKCGYESKGTQTISTTASWQRVSMTITASATQFNFVIYNIGGTASTIQVKDFMFEVGNVAHTYEPYANVCPISGWDEVNVTRCGKNLWDRDNIRRGVYTNSDGTTQSASASTNISSQFIKIKPNTIYSITMFGESYENGSLFGVYYDEYKNGIKQTTNIQNLISNNSKTFTTPLNAHYIVFSGYRGAGTDIFTTANTVVCEGTPTTYEPYNGHTYTIDLDGTRYGGELDVVSGVLTVDRVGIVYDGSSDEVWTISPSDATAKIIGTATGLVYTYSPILSNCFATYDSQAWNYDNTIWSRYGQVHVNPDSSIIPSGLTTEGLAEWRTWLSTHNLQICYSLATPLTIQLTPTQVKSLLGVNNIWADTGDVLDAEYTRDATTIINSLIARIEELENQ